MAGGRTATTDAERAHVARLTAALRYEPCAPTCANWLLYGVQPRNLRPGLWPGCCRGKAHRPDNLGYGGRRVLVSRKWSGKNLADHRADRRAFVLSVLGHDIEDHDRADQQAGRYAWEPARPTDPDVPPLTHCSCTPSPNGPPGASNTARPEPPTHPKFRQPRRPPHEEGPMPAIRVSVSIRPDEETAVVCHIYPDRPPILAIFADRHTFTIGGETTAGAAQMVTFANALFAAAHRYLDAVRTRAGQDPPDDAPRMFPHHPTR